MTYYENQRIEIGATHYAILTDQPGEVWLYRACDDSPVGVYRSIKQATNVAENDAVERVEHTYHNARANESEIA